METKRYCACGCGEATSGRRKFRLGHFKRLPREEKLKISRTQYNKNRRDKIKRGNEFGLCRCGCGNKTPKIKRKTKDNASGSVEYHVAFVWGHQWRQHKIDTAFEYSRRSAIRNAAEKVYGTACVMCGWGASSLDVAHLSGGHKMTDVVLLCPNCHRLLDNGVTPIESVLSRQDLLLKAYLKEVP